jgi:threonine dehydrogenase-like Zn-dependent dehydrogenase
VEERSAELVIDAVGSGATRAAASALAAPGGTIVHVGLQDGAEGLDTRRLTLQEIAFLGAYCYTAADFAEALRLLAEGTVRGAGWAEVRPLEAGPVAFREIDAGDAPPKIILRP